MRRPRQHHDGERECSNASGPRRDACRQYRSFSFRRAYLAPHAAAPGSLQREVSGERKQAAGGEGGDGLAEGAGEEVAEDVAGADGVGAGAQRGAGEHDAAGAEDEGAPRDAGAADGDDGDAAAARVEGARVELVDEAFAPGADQLDDCEHHEPDADAEEEKAPERVLERRGHERALLRRGVADVEDESHRAREQRRVGDADDEVDEAVPQSGTAAVRTLQVGDHLDEAPQRLCQQSHREQREQDVPTGALGELMERADHAARLFRVEAAGSVERDGGDEHVHRGARRVADAAHPATPATRV